MTKDLKLCPTCNSEARVMVCITDRNGIFIQCSKCGMRTRGFSTETWAKRAWNKRIK